MKFISAQNDNLKLYRMVKKKEKEIGELGDENKSIVVQVKYNERVNYSNENN